MDQQSPVELMTDFVIYVQGPPRRGSAQDECSQIIEQICGSIQKTLMGPFESQDFLSEKIGRLLRLTPRPIDVRDMSSVQRGVLVLTDFSDLMFSVIRPRRDLTRAHPALSRLLWVAFIDEDQPFFERAAQDIGTLDASLDQAPVWSVKSEDQKYLVLTSRTNPTLARRNARSLVPSGFAKITSHGFAPPSPEAIAEAKLRAGKL